MSAQSVPASIVQGTTHEWTVTESDYSPAAGWTLAYVLRSSRQSQTVAGVQSGASWDVTLTKAITAALYPGVFSWQAFVTDAGGTERHLIASGVLDVLPDVSATQQPPHDARSVARKRLESLNDMLSSSAFVKTLLPEQIESLERVRKQAEWDVKREADAEKLRAGGYPTNKILVRFRQ